MLRRLSWTLTHGRWNPGWRARLASFEALAGLSPEAHRAARDAAVADHVAWAARTLPYWRQRAASARRLEDLPILTRAEVQAHREALRDPSRPPTALHMDSTGGSTGEPVRFYHDADLAISTFATELLLGRWWGVAPWARTAYVWGDDRELGGSAKERLQAWSQGRVHLNAFHVDAARLRSFAARLRRFRPEVVQGYATALDLLAAHLLGDGGAPVRPRVVRSAAEALFPDRRARIEQAFGVPVRDVYGSRETPCLAAECAHGGFHVMGHTKVIELVDEGGAPVPAGVPGRVLVTDLHNRAFGFLRYANGDVASWSEDDAPCPCGVAWPRLKAVHGRSSDFITTPAGLRVHGEWFTHLFYGRDDVRRFQLRQTALHHVDLLTEGPADAAALAPVLDAIRARLGVGVQVAWRAVERIDTGPSGKHRFTVSDVPFLAGRP